MICARPGDRLPDVPRVVALVGLGVLLGAAPALAGPPAMVALTCPEGSHRKVRSGSRSPAEGSIGLPWAPREVVCVDAKGVPSGPALQLRSAFKQNNRSLLGEPRLLRRHVIRVGGYLQGVRHGVWKQMDRNGEVLGVNRIDRGDGTWRVWHESGQEGAAGLLQGDLRHGQWHFRHRRGNRAATGTYHRGKRHGLWEFWDSNGDLDRVSWWRDGAKHGLETRWFSNGEKRSEGSWLGERRDGDWWYFNKRGELLGRNHLDRGTGHWIEWYDGGHKRSEGDLAAGQPHGPWTRWHDNGGKEAEGRYESGVLVRKTWTYWDRNGKVKAQGGRSGLLGRLGALRGLGGGAQAFGKSRGGVIGGGGGGIGQLRRTPVGRSIGGRAIAGVRNSFVSRTTIKKGNGRMVTTHANWADSAGDARHVMVLYRPPASVDLTGAGLSATRDDIKHCGIAWIARQPAPAVKTSGARPKYWYQTSRFRIAVGKGKGTRATALHRAKALDSDWHHCVAAALNRLHPTITGPSSHAQFDVTVVMR